MGKTSRLETLAFILVLLWAAGASFLGAASPVDENIRLLRGQDAGERVAAVIALGELGARAGKAVPALRTALDDPEPMVRERAAEALGKTGARDNKTILALIGRFADEDPFVAGKAVGAVAGMGGAAVEHLLRSLTAGNDSKRWGAAIALGRIAPAGAQAIAPLASALLDKSPDVRWCAAIALGKFAGAAAPAVPGLLARLHDDDRDVRWAAAIALGKIAGETIDRAPEFSGVIEKLERLTPQWMKELQVPGVAISVIRHHELAWSRSFGVADATQAAAVSDQTAFEACSMSKPVFACLALQLAEQGKLDLDRPLGDYLPEEFVHADDYAKLITARMILTHTSGLPNWRKGGEEREGPLPIYFKPGTKFSYSGEGIYYLQRVVERITREPLAAYAKRNLFDKLGLASTSFVWTAALGPRIATGHDLAGQCLPRSRYTHANAAYTLYTTPNDYAAFIIRIMKPHAAAGFSLSEQTTADMFTRHVRMDTRDVIDRPGRSLGTSAYRGLGWVIDATISGDIVYHSGSNQTGFTCYAQFNREEGSGIVIMTNGKNGSELWTKLIGAIGDL